MNFNANDARNMTYETSIDDVLWDVRIAASQQGKTRAIVAVPRRSQKRLTQGLRERGFFCVAAFGLLFISWNK